MELIFIPIKCSSIKVEKHIIFLKGLKSLSSIFAYIYDHSQNSVLVE